MAILSTANVFPVVSLNLGNYTEEKIVEKKLYTLTKSYYAVFCVKSPNRVYFITGDDSVTVPKLSELLKSPCLDLTTMDYQIPLPVNPINTLVDFLKDPTKILSGFCLYDLYSMGFITSDYFASRILGMLSSMLSANGIEVDSINSQELIKISHQSQASKLGLSGDNLTLKDRLKGFLNTSKTTNIIEVNPTVNNAVTVDAVTVKNDQSTDPRLETPESESLDPLESFDGDLSDTVNVNLTTMNKKDLLSYAKKLGLNGLSKKTVKQIRDSITEKLTSPDPVNDDPVMVETPQQLVTV